MVGGTVVGGTAKGLTAWGLTRGGCPGRRGGEPCHKDDCAFRFPGSLSPQAPSR